MFSLPTESLVINFQLLVSRVKIDQLAKVSFEHQHKTDNLMLPVIKSN